MDIEYEFGRFWYPRINKILEVLEDDEVKVEVVQRGETLQGRAVSKKTGTVLEKHLSAAWPYYWCKVLGKECIDMGKFAESMKRDLAKKGEVPQAKDTMFSKEFPALWDLITCTRFSDGSLRTPATLIMFVEDGMWKACLSDRETGRVAFVTADCQNALLPSLEDALQTGKLDWRVSRQGGQKKGR